MAFNPNKCLKFTAYNNNTEIWFGSTSGASPIYYFMKEGTDQWEPGYIRLDANESAYCKGTAFPSHGPNAGEYQKFSMSKEVDISGSVMSLVDDGAGEPQPLTPYCFYKLFSQLRISQVASGLLPATQLAAHCYDSMFLLCTEKLVVPTDLLPATTLAEYCYANMFNSMTRFDRAPILPATQLVEGCYNGMFYGCISLPTLTVYFSDWNNGQSTVGWVKDLSNYSGGPFYAPAALPVLRGDDYIPLRWEKEEAPEPPKPVIKDKVVKILPDIWLIANNPIYL